MSRALAAPRRSLECSPRIFPRVFPRALRRAFPRVALRVFPQAFPRVSPRVFHRAFPGVPRALQEPSVYLAVGQLESLLYCTWRSPTSLPCTWCRCSKCHVFMAETPQWGFKCNGPLRPLGCSLECSLGHSPGCSLGLPVGRSLGRSLGCFLGRPLGVP